MAAGSSLVRGVCILKIRILLVISLASLVSFSSAQGRESSSINMETVGSVVYSGETTPAEIMADQVDKIHTLDPEAQISFSVSIPVVKENRQLVQSIDGLPIEKTSPDSVIKEVSLELPFELQRSRRMGRSIMVGFRPMWMRHLSDCVPVNHIIH
jgi:hypothetical protein